MSAVELDAAGSNSCLRRSSHGPEPANMQMELAASRAAPPPSMTYQRSAAGAIVTLLQPNVEKPLQSVSWRRRSCISPMLHQCLFLSSCVLSRFSCPINRVAAGSRPILPLASCGHLRRRQRPSTPKQVYACWLQGWFRRYCYYHLVLDPLIIVPGTRLRPHPGRFAIRRRANINLDYNLPVPRATLWYLHLTSCSSNPVGTSCSNRPYYPTIALGADYNYSTTATSSHLSTSSIYILSSYLHFSLRLTSRRQRASLKKETTIPTHT